MGSKRLVHANLYGEDDGSMGREVRRERQNEFLGGVDSKLKNTMLELEYGVDFDDYIVYLSEEIRSGSLYEIVAKFKAILKVRPIEDAKKPVTLFIDSVGGDVYSSFGIIDFIRSLPVAVNTVCRGQAMSAASLILACGTGVRAASTNSTIMVHEISSDNGFVKTSEAQASYEHLVKLNKIYYGLYSEVTKRDAEFWKEKMKVDYYLTAEEARELNLIDKVI